MRMLCVLLMACTAGTEVSVPYVLEDGRTDGLSEDGNAHLFVPGGDSRFELFIDDAGLTELGEDPYEWVSGAFVFEGQRYEPVAIRLKGHGSFQPIDQKPSFKIDFDRYLPGQQFYGLDKVVLNNANNDPGLLREVLAYTVYREMGVPAARSGHVEVDLNGQPLGTYIHDEEPDERMVRRWFYGSSGSMYEIYDADFVPAQVQAFEHEFGPENLDRHRALADALEWRGPSALDQVMRYVHRDALLDYLAVGAVIGQFDAYPYSTPGDDVHVYNDPASQRLYLVPHGTDETFRQTDRPVEVMQGVLGQRCVEDERCRADFHERIDVVLQRIDDIGLYEQSEQWAEQLLGRDLPANFEAQVGVTQQFIVNRRSDLDSGGR